MRARLMAMPGLAVWVGLSISAVGIALVALAWGQAAGEPEVARQLPYVASAAFPGLGLVVIGGLVVALQASVNANDTRREQLEELQRLALGEEPAASSPLNWRDPGVFLFGGLIAAGFVAFVITWRVCAPTLDTNVQVAALISGGAGGLALVLLGAALLYVQVNRRLHAVEANRFEAALAQLSEAP